MTQKETDGFVSVVNSLIEKYCKQYPDEYEFDQMSIWYDEDGRIYCSNGDDLAETLEWVNEEVIPDLCNNFFNVFH